jgi:hypothetical protein
MKPRALQTPTWLVTVVLQILAPEGYGWNFTETDD